MADSERSRTGLTYQQAFDSITIASIPVISGVGGGPISAAFILFGGSNLPHNDPSIGLQIFPGEKTSSGTDSSGNISVTMTIVNSGDDKTFDIAGGGQAVFSAGFWANSIRGVSNTADGVYEFYIDASVLELSDFTESLTDTPGGLNSSSPSFNPETEEGQVDLTFTYNNADGEDPVSLAILRDGGSGAEIIGYVPWEDGTILYSYTDYVFSGGSFTYTIRAYKYDPSPAISPPSGSIIVSFSESLPDISVISDLMVDISLNSDVFFIGDPSGIYTLIKDKTHDTLYERSGLTDSVDVAIPTPFIRTAFLP